MQRQPTSPVLYVFAGLPGVGKSTLAQSLAGARGAVYLRIDTVEQALRELCGIEVEGEGYRLAYRVAADNLPLGVSVVADSCNPIELTRDEWEHVAAESGSRHVNIEVVCSDPTEHRGRVESRVAATGGHPQPTWADVQRREYHPWTRPRVVVDTRGRSADACFEELLSALARDGL